MFKKYIDLVSDTIFDGKTNRLTLMLKCIQVCNGNMNGH